MNRLSRNVFLLCLAVLLLGACAGRDRTPIYVQSEEIEPIRVPQGLDEPRVRSAFLLGGFYLPELAAQHDARPPRVLPSAEAERSRSHIRFGPRGLFLEVQDEPDSVWRRLGFSLNRAGMQIQEVREERRQYAFIFTDDPLIIQPSGLSRLAFWRGAERVDHSGEFLAELEPASEGITRVLLMDRSGNLLEMDRAEHVLSVLRERLG